MADAAVPLPDDMVVAEPPLSDDDLDAYLAWADEHAWDEDPPGADPLAEVDADPEAYRDDLVAALPVYRWLIESLDDAEWAMATLATAQHHVAELGAQRDEWLRAAQDRIDRWHRRASRRSARTAQVMAAKLERYGLEQRAVDPKVKSIPLPSGVVKTTEAKPTAKVLDDGAVGDHVALSIVADTADSAWRKALEAAGLEPADVFVESTKVMVVPFRKVVTVAEVPTGVVRYIVDLTCEHTITDEFGADDLEASTEVPPLGSYLPCTECASDPIDGPPERGVAAVERLELTEWRVLGPDGQPVPGTSVDLGGTTAKAVPGA